MNAIADNASWTKLCTTQALGEKVSISFTPHLIPMSRGMQSTMYCQTTVGTSVEAVRDALQVPWVIMFIFAYNLGRL